VSGEVVGHEPCDLCGSSDNVALYADGHRHCFTPGCGFHTKGDGETHQRRTPRLGLLTLDYRALPPRCLSEAACRKFGVGVGKLGEETVVVFEYRNQDGQVVAQKCRTKAKDFPVLGDSKAMLLFGQHLWPGKGKRVVVTEGELDAVALCQVQDLKWPVVSIPSGAGSAAKAIAKSREWLEGFDEVVLAFDADDAGREGVSKAAAILTPGKVRVADFGPLGVKDANEALMKANDGQPDLIRKMISAVWDARTWRPDGVVSLKDIRERVLTTPTVGYSWPWKSLNDLTFGRRVGEVIGLGAGTGQGKSDFVSQCVAHDVSQGLRVGVISLEQDVGDTGKRIAGKLAHRRFHVPDGSWKPEELEAAWAKLEATDAVKLYDNFGVADWATIKARINYMVDVEGCQVVWLDNLTGIVAAEEDERRALEMIMAEAASMAKGRFVFMFVSHLATPEGKSHEEGGRVTIRHYKGSRSIGYWSHFLLALERDQQAEDPEERITTTVRFLKDRNTGQATGRTVDLRYDEPTGMLNEIDAASEFNENGAVTADAIGL
jgi:twinkle protein